MKDVALPIIRQLTWATLDVFKTLEDALYFSLTSYATIGYGDVVLSHQWRILGAIEGVNGILMLGWSIAFLVGVVGRFRHMQHR